MANLVNFESVFFGAAQKAEFNSGGYQTVGDPKTLKEVWQKNHPGLYEQVDGDKATVIAKWFDGATEPSLRLSIPLRNGVKIEERLSSKSNLEEGDTVLIESIKGTLYYKAGGQPEYIVRYDGELAE
jgi:hypothetical protein